MNPTDTADRRLAVLFADVVGSTALYEQLGDARAFAAIDRCLAWVGALATAHGGRLIKTIGDAVLVVFERVDQAAEAAAVVQARGAEPKPAGEPHIVLRIGFHFGAAIERDQDVVGDSVNVAARMVALANGGQVLLSEPAAMELSPWLRGRLRELDVLALKGKEKGVRVFELLWQESSDDLTTVGNRPLPRTASRLELRHGAREIGIDAATSVVTLGRDPGNDVVLVDRLASRLHGRIERRRDKFVLVDQSSNGTFVTIDGEPEIQLRREEMILRGRGRISFGHSISVDSAETVSFAWIEGEP